MMVRDIRREGRLLDKLDNVVIIIVLVEARLIVTGGVVRCQMLVDESGS